MLDVVVDNYDMNKLVELEILLQEVQRQREEFQEARNARNNGKITPYTARVEVDEETGLTQLEKELAVLEGDVYYARSYINSNYDRNEKRIIPRTAKYSRIDDEEETGLTQLEKELAVLERSV